MLCIDSIPCCSLVDSDSQMKDGEGGEEGVADGGGDEEGGDAAGAKKKGKKARKRSAGRPTVKCSVLTGVGTAHGSDPECCV